MTTPLLETTDLTLGVAGRTLVRALDFRMEAGQIWCLLGPNGAGKTTFLHTVVGLRPPQGGGLRLAGRALGDWPAPEAARQRGFLPQTFHDAFSVSVLDCVLQGRHPFQSRWHWEDDADRTVARAALAAVDLAGFDSRDVLTLSSGERQRVALATLLVQDVPLLLLDEPVSHLDLRHQIIVLTHLQKLAREHGRGVLLTIHDLNLAARFASHALILTADGSVHQGPIDQVMTESDLSAAFGHPVSRTRSAGQTLFVPG